MLRRRRCACRRRRRVRRRIGWRSAILALRAPSRVLVVEIGARVAVPLSGRRHILTIILRTYKVRAKEK